MKQTYILSLITVAILSVFASCDIVTDPIQQRSNGGGDTSSTDTNTIDVQPLLNVLVEDFTGQKCGNCPEAADELKVLKDTYGDRVVGLSVHAGFFADHTKFGIQVDDILRIDDGQATFDYFQVVSNPNGMVSRTDFGSGKVVGFPKWFESVNILAPSGQEVLAPVSIVIDASYNESDGKITANVSGKFFENISSDLKITVLVSEDKLEAPQYFYKDISGRTEEGWEYDYIHDHVLRTFATNYLGDDLFAGGVVENDTFNKDYTIQTDSKWLKENLYVVVFISDSDNRVLHVDEVHPSLN